MADRGSGGMSFFSSIDSSEAVRLGSLIRTRIPDEKATRVWHSLRRVRIRVDDEELADDLPSEPSPRPSEEGVIARLVREHRGEVRPSRLPADEKALGQIRLQKRGVLNNLNCARNIE